MITDTFDNLTEEIIKVGRNENAKKVDACILTFSNEILKYVLEQYDCTKIGDLYSSNGANPVYGFSYNGKEFAVYMSYVGAPGCVADIEDTMTVINTDKYVVFGGSGCLNKDIARGRVMVPTAAYRDEGTSYHYAPASDYITVKNSDVVAAFMEEAGLRMLCIVRQGVILKKERPMAAYPWKWNAQPYRPCVTTEDLMHISSLHAEIFWMHLNGMPERKKIKRSTLSTIPVILRLRWNWHRIL